VLRARRVEAHSLLQDRERFTKLL
jgi:hypothetical protein